MKHQGKLSIDEVILLGESLHTTEGHLQLILPDGDAPSRTPNDPQKPSWISDKVRRLLCGHDIDYVCACTLFPRILDEGTDQGRVVFNGCMCVFRLKHFLFVCSPGVVCFNSRSAFLVSVGCH